MSIKKLCTRRCFQLLALVVLVASVGACKKYLEAKPDKKLAIPSTTEDLQALLDNTFTTTEMTPSGDEASADDYYLTETGYNSISLPARRVYTWQTPPDPLPSTGDWGRIYNSIYVPNVCLDALPTIAKTNQNEPSWNNVKGSALFMRALGFLRGAFIFAKAWDEASADTDYGVVLRLNADFNEKSTRATLRETYNQIIKDLLESAPLLPVTPRHVNRPSRPAAYALLARAFLSMRKYDSCFKYTNLSLQLKDDLLDYNNPSECDPNNILFPFQRYHKEIIFCSSLGAYSFEGVAPYTARLDTGFYDSYDDNDIRKVAFYTDLFGDGYAFQGTYDGSFSNLFLGIAVDEVLLMRAEAHARAGRATEAMSDLNTLLVNRWKTGTFTPLFADNAAKALQQVLTERRKELIFRGLRWMDLKRFNKEGANITLTRHIDGQAYTLPPNDNRYAMLIPDEIIRLAQIPQNPR